MNRKKSYTSYSVNHIIDFSWITQVGIQITLFKIYSQNQKNDRMIQNDVISIYYLL